MSLLQDLFRLERAWKAAPPLFHELSNLVGGNRAEERFPVPLSRAPLVTTSPAKKLQTPERVDAPRTFVCTSWDTDTLGKQNRFAPSQSHHLCSPTLLGLFALLLYADFRERGKGNTPTLAKSSSFASGRRLPPVIRVVQTLVQTTGVMQAAMLDAFRKECKSFFKFFRGGVC